LYRIYVIEVINNLKPLRIFDYYFNDYINNNDDFNRSNYRNDNCLFADGSSRADLNLLTHLMVCYNRKDGQTNTTQNNINNNNKQYNDYLS